VGDPAEVLAWRLSNTVDADFCIEAIEGALSRHGQPGDFNTEQGSTSPAVT
jgi:putative transposase